MREGDSWSPAKIVKREGRKYQIRYDDGTEEWVTSLSDPRRRGRGESLNHFAVRGESDESETAKPQKPAKRKKFQPRDQVEIFWGASWFPGTIKKVKGSLYLVHYDKWSSHFDEWVAITRLRRPGEESDDSPLPTSCAPPGPAERCHRRNDRTPWARSQWRSISTAGAGRSGSAPGGREYRRYGRPAVAEQGGAKFTPDPAAGKLNPRSIVLKGGAGGHFPHVAGVAFGRDVAFAAISEGSRKGISVIERLDLKSGRSTGTWPLLPEMSLTAVSPDGGRLLLQSDRLFHGTKGRLDIFTLEKSKPEYATGFLPYQSIDEKVEGRELVRGCSMVVTFSPSAATSRPQRSFSGRLRALRRSGPLAFPAHAEPCLVRAENNSPFHSSIKSSSSMRSAAKRPP